MNEPYEKEDTTADREGSLVYTSDDIAEARRLATLLRLKGYACRVVARASESPLAEEEGEIAGDDVSAAQVFDLTVPRQTAFEANEALAVHLDGGGPESDQERLVLDVEDYFHTRTRSLAFAAIASIIVPPVGIFVITQSLVLLIQMRRARYRGFPRVLAAGGLAIGMVACAWLVFLVLTVIAAYKTQ